MATNQSSFVDERRGDTWINVLIGAVAGFALSTVLPLGGQLLGGGVAGYLQGTTRTEGAKVGGIAAAVSTIPGAAVVVLIFVPFVTLLLGVDLAAGAFSGVFLLAVVGAVVFGLLTAVLAGLAGGYLGAMLAQD